MYKVLDCSPWISQKFLVRFGIFGLLEKLKRININGDLLRLIDSFL